MKEFSDSIKATLYERATSPLYSTFVFSWLIWNWKIPMVILFGDKQFTRIEYIDNYVDSFEIPFLTLLIWPLLSALILLLLLPYFSNWIYKIALKFKQKRLDFKTKSESSSILSAEKALELYKELSEIKSQLASEIQSKEQENQTLSKQINELTDNLKLEQLKALKSNELIETVQKQSREYEQTFVKLARTGGYLDQIITLLTLESSLNNPYRIASILLMRFNQAEILNIEKKITKELLYESDGDLGLEYHNIIKEFTQYNLLDIVDHKNSNEKLLVLNGLAREVMKIVARLDSSHGSFLR